MTILLSDPRVAAIPLHETGDPLVPLDPTLGRHVRVRAEIASRLAAAQEALPSGYRLRVVEGHRSVADQRAIVSSYGAELRAAHPGLPESEIAVLSSRFVAPLEVAPHIAGAAVDLTLTDVEGRELDLGTPIDATLEQSGGKCYFGARVDAEARINRTILARALESVGFVNYPTEWWHWSYGDRYWALSTGAPAALYGPVRRELAA
jgi:D-alanyl-D-alanine dipeptidase